MGSLFLDPPTADRLFPREVALLPGPPSEQATGERLAAQVVFTHPGETVFTYLLPEGLRDAAAPGKRVRVPFGKQDRNVVGYCVGVGPASPTTRSLKWIEAVLDEEPLLSPQMLELARWMADHYLCGLGQVLDSVVPRGVKRQAGTRLVTYYRPAPGLAEKWGRSSGSESASPVNRPIANDNGPPELELTAKQRAVLEVLCGYPRPLRLDELKEAAGCGAAPVKALLAKGLIEATSERAEEFCPDLAAVTRDPDLRLNPSQQAALDAILAAIRSGEHRTLLLHGVTGSGKTEVYCQAIREVTRAGRQAIVLVPEISLTPQTIRRFRTRFDSVAVLHSHLSDAERNWHWQQIARGAVEVVVGARSAIFAPTPRLGLIVIDEEHETTFKQDTVPRYHARDVARQRARLEQVPLVLGSATPTMESWLRVERKEDLLLSLPHRVENRQLPPVVVVDVRHDPQCARGSAIGRALESAMTRSLEDGGQVILFLNLRGYSPTIYCVRCGYAAKCEDCDITLTYHKDRDVSLCHCCGREISVSKCPRCGHPRISYLGSGTQRLEREVREKFADYPCVRMDSDSMRRFGSHDAALEAFRRREVRILVGTQMIAKGLDFPDVTLVGVISADMLLRHPDFRASERTFQLISQVAGRTGRGPRGGRVFVQTIAPAEPAIRHAAEHDYLGFAAEELARRRELLLPPFSHMVRVILRGPEEENVKGQADRMATVFEETARSLAAPVRILGPAPAPVTRIKGNWRYHFHLAAERFEPLAQLWRKTIERIARRKDVEYVVDVDPINMR